jgi:hypothetical protein
MFESLADQIRHDERERLSTRERLALWIVIGDTSEPGIGPQIPSCSPPEPRSAGVLEGASS